MNVVKRETRYACVDLLLGSGYRWLARDLNGSVAAYSHKPFKLDDECWRVEEGESKEMWMWVDDGDLYNFVKWEDDEPVNIREWLEKEEEEMKMYSVKDGELECREVDATNGIVALGVNDVVELDRDNKIVTDGVTVVKLQARNSGRSAILEKAKTLGGLLKNANTEAMNSQEKQLYCAGEKVNIGDQIFVAKENEVFTVADIMTDGTVVTTPNINGCTRYFRPELIRLLNASVDGDAISEKATTLGGLLAPRELDRDNNIIPDDASVAELNDENWGEGVILEKAKLIREALEMAKDYGYEPSVSIVADQLEYRHEPLDATLIDKIVSGIDVNRDIDYRPITLDDLSNVQIHGKVCKELTETYKKKNADYGNSFENSLDKHGMIAGIVRMDDKMSRLISLNSKNEQLVLEESMRDTLMDLANYAIMSVMWLDEQ